MKTLEQLAREAGASLHMYGTMPDGTNEFRGATFTPETLARFRAAVLEEAAQLCEARVQAGRGTLGRQVEAMECASAIREAKGKA